jgi:hypothetical protein
MAIASPIISLASSIDVSAQPHDVLFLEKTRSIGIALQVEAEPRCVKRVCVQ